MSARVSSWKALLVAFLAMGTALAFLPACGDDGGSDSEFRSPG